MVDTRKFSEFNNGGIQEEGQTTVGLESGANTRFTTAPQFLPAGTTGERPVPATAGMIRYNTSLNLYEYFNGTQWAQFEDSADIALLIARLAAHTAGDGASMIGLQNQGSVSNQTVQNMAEADFIVKSVKTALVNAIALSDLSTGIIVNETGTGNLVARSVTGTTNQTTVTNGTGLAGNINVAIANNPTLPGSSHVQIPFGNTAARPVTPTNGYLRYNTQLDELEYWDNNALAWVQVGASGSVFSVVGTVNEIDVNSVDPANPVLSLSPTLDLPGTMTIQNSTIVDEIINDSSMATATATNLSTSEAIKEYVDSLAQGLTVKAAVQSASTTAYTAIYNNGVAGVGGTLTNNDTQAVFEADSIQVGVGQRVLIKDQADSVQNGIYVVTDAGSVSSNWVLTRAADFDEPTNIVAGSLVPVLNGTTQGGTKWVQTEDVATVGTDDIDFILWMINVNRIVTTDTAQTITGEKTMDDLVLGGDMDADSNKIINLLDPTNAQDAATKAYVDGLASQIVQYSISTSLVADVTTSTTNVATSLSGSITPTDSNNLILIWVNAPMRARGTGSSLQERRNQVAIERTSGTPVIFPTDATGRDLPAASSTSAWSFMRLSLLSHEIAGTTSAMTYRVIQKAGTTGNESTFGLTNAQSTMIIMELKV
jgi:hypothetical protein